MLKKIMLISFFISLSWKTIALSSINSAGCTNQFVGEVVNMVNMDTPFSSLKKTKLDLHVSSRIRGEEKEYEEIYYPEGGLDKFKIGDTFKVSLKDGLICSLQRI
jgi:hypothetical protein